MPADPVSSHLCNPPDAFKAGRLMATGWKACDEPDMIETMIDTRQIVGPILRWSVAFVSWPLLITTPPDRSAAGIDLSECIMKLFVVSDTKARNLLLSLARPVRFKLMDGEARDDDWQVMPDLP